MTRKAAVSGVFYHSDRQSLKDSIAAFMQQVEVPHPILSIRGIIVPHAGYTYSGSVAAYAYKVLKESQPFRKLSRVIMLGPAHRKYVPVPVTDTNDHWETPLGKVPVFRLNFLSDKEAHLQEHCLEVQLPFLQTVLTEFEILPLLLSDRYDDQTLPEKILNQLDSRTLLLISTDLSHYYSYQEAITKDEKTLSHIRNLDIARFKKQGDACGKAAVEVALQIAQKCHWQATQLCYQNSGDICGDLSSVVGYASLVFSE